MDLQYATFYVGRGRFGINILTVREINRHLDITPVERAPDYVRGLLNLRGQIVTVVDLGVRLGLGPRTIGPESRCIVLKTTADMNLNRSTNLTEDSTSEDLIGLLIDQVGDMVSLTDKELEPAPANVSGVDSKYISGVAKLSDGLMVALRTREILSLEEAA